MFGADHVEVLAYGNVLTSVAFLEGIATGELRGNELENHDPQFPMLITVRAYRPQTMGRPPGERDPRGPANN